MKVYIVEDELFHLEDLKITLEELNHECVGHSGDPLEAQEQIGQLDVEAVLVDIHLRKKQSGITFARNLKKLQQLPILFISSDKTPPIMSEAADIDPIAYLTKPVKSDDLRAALILAERQLKKISQKNTVQSAEIYIKNGNKLVKVRINDILFVHTDSKNYCSLVTSSNQKLTFRNSILGFYQLLDTNIFMQTHRSYIVNLNRVTSFHEINQTIKVEEHTIPVGRTFRKRLYERIKIV